jgi:hypothetical protein
MSSHGIETGDPQVWYASPCDSKAAPLHDVKGIPAEDSPNALLVFNYKSSISIIVYRTHIFSEWKVSD